MAVPNHCILKLEPAASVAMMELARGMKAKGIDVISLAGGEPDFDTPPAVVEACEKAIREGRTHYTTGRGILPFRERICRKLEEENGIRCTPENILVTPGGKYAIHIALLSFTNPGDGVMMLDPSWVSYAPLITLAGGVPIRVPLDMGDHYRITEETLERYAAPETKILIVNTPNNPTGRVLTEEEAKAIAAFAQKRDILILADEVYEKIIFDGRKHISLGSLPEIADRVITVNSFSKCAAMTGWRIGYLCASREITDTIYLAYQHALTCISEFSQIAAMTALDCVEDVERMRASYERRRGILIDGLRSIPGIQCLLPEGAFYAWCRMDHAGAEPGKLSDFLLKEAHVVTVDGKAYGPHVENCVRMCFAAAETDLIEAVDRIGAAMGN